MLLRPTAHRTSIAGLDCVVVDPVAAAYEPTGVVVLCHGFGAPGTDLVDCCRAFWELEPIRLERVRFAFPAAPLRLDEQAYGDGRAWWMIDMDRLLASIDSGEIRNLRHESPPELPARRAQLTECLETLRTQAGVGWERVFLGGFSQGAMLSTDTALHLPERCGGLVVWSGTLLAESTWRRAAERSDKFPVFLSHGRFDPILPFAGAVGLQMLLHDAGFPVDFVAFDGMHEIPMPAMRGAAALLARQLAP